MGSVTYGGFYDDSDPIYQDCANDEVHAHYTHARGKMDFLLNLYIFNHIERK